MQAAPATARAPDHCGEVALLQVAGRAPQRLAAGERQHQLPPAAGVQLQQLLAGRAAVAGRLQAARLHAVSCAGLSVMPRCMMPQWSAGTCIRSVHKPAMGASTRLLAGNGRRGPARRPPAQSWGRPACALRTSPHSSARPLTCRQACRAPGRRPPCRRRDPAAGRAHMRGCGWALVQCTLPLPGAVERPRMPGPHEPQLPAQRAGDSAGSRRPAP